MARQRQAGLTSKEVSHGQDKESELDVPGLKGRQSNRPTQKKEGDIFSGEPKQVLEQLLGLHYDHTYQEGAKCSSLTEHSRIVAELLANDPDFHREMTVREFAQHIARTAIQEVTTRAALPPGSINPEEVAREAVLAFLRQATEITSSPSVWFHDHITGYVRNLADANHEELKHPGTSPTDERMSLVAEAVFVENQGDILLFPRVYEKLRKDKTAIVVYTEIFGRSGKDLSRVLLDIFKVVYGQMQAQDREIVVEHFGLQKPRFDIGEHKNKTRFPGAVSKAEGGFRRLVQQEVRKRYDAGGSDPDRPIYRKLGARLGKPPLRKRRKQPPKPYRAAGAVPGTPNP